MNRVGLLMFGLLVVACGSDTEGSGETATGGQTSVQTGSGGASYGGAAALTGGATAMGGAISTGGITASGGAPVSTGGSLATGGVAPEVDAGQDAEPPTPPEAGAGGAPEAGEFDAGSRGGVVSTGGATATGGAPACECTAGACCDGCHLKPAGEICFSGPFRSYCPAPTTSSCDNRAPRLLVEHRIVYCTGASAACEGEGELEKVVEGTCAPAKYCVENTGTGRLTATCATCPK